MPVVIFGVFAALANVFGQAQIKVPKGRPVMMDGKAEPGEWSDAYVKRLPGGVRLYAKRSEEFLWLAIELPQGGDGAVDLYVSPAPGEIYDLHASAKLGERRLEQGKWPDWQWWSNRAWTANVWRVDSLEKRSFLPTRAREDQIRLDRFPAHAWKMMFELLTPAEPEWKTTVYPLGASNLNSKDWWTLVLDKE